jgi:hypothetical protein
MAAIDPQDVADAAAVKLRQPPADVLPYATAAVAYVVSYTGLPELEDGDARLFEGLVLLTMRMFQDGPVPGGSVSSFDDFTAGGFIPRDLANHLRDYWDHLNVAWPFA